MAHSCSDLPRVALAPVLLALSVLAAPAHAHRTWLLPSASVVIAKDKDALVSVDAAVSEDLFEFDTTALQLDGLSITAPDGSPVAAENRSTARRRSSFDLKLTQPGTYRIAHVTETVVASYKQGGEAKRWRGTPDGLAAFARELPADAQDLQVTRLHARVETFVTNDRSDEKALARTFAPAGTGLELLPLTPPTDLSVGDTSRFRLLLDGAPLADAPITILRGGNRYRYKLGELVLKTDAQGHFSVRWPEAGRYWIGATQGGRQAPAAGASSAAVTAAAASAPEAPAERGTPTQPVRRASYSATVEVLPQ